MTGRLLSVEGIEGAGKSTALTFINDYLTKAGFEVMLTREPGGTPVAEEMRQVVLHSKSSEEIVPLAELLMMFAGRAQHIHHVILPALKTNKWIVSDRYIDASYAYQGGGRGIKLSDIATLDQWIVAGLYPALTLLLDVSPEVGFERARIRGNDRDRIESEQIVFFTRVRDVYLQRAIEDPKRIKVIDASVSLASVQKQIQERLDEFIANNR